MGRISERSAGRLSVTFLIFISLVLFFGYGKTAEAQLETVKIHDFRGMVDRNDTTHLFYRIYELEIPDDGEYVQEDRNHVYHINTATRTDSLFLGDALGVYVGPNGWSPTVDRVTDFVFPARAAEDYILSAYGGQPDHTWRVSYKQDTVLAGGYGGYRIPLMQDPRELNRVYVYFLDGTTKAFEKRNGQWNRDSTDTVYDDLSYHLLSIDPRRDSTAFGRANNKLVRSRGSKDYMVVDTSRYWSEFTTIYYDSDSKVIYARDFERGEHQKVRKSVLYRSTESGKAGTWQRIDQDSSLIAFESDPRYGNIYKNNGNTLLKSSDQGEHYKPVASFSRRITGIYKPDKENGVLFVSTISDIWRLEDGNKIESVKHVEAGVDEYNTSIPDRIQLEQNYPNPFNPITIIRFGLPRPADVQLTVYDRVGRHVATLVNGRRRTGTHSVTFNAGNLASGVYFYRLKTEEISTSRKMLLVK